MLDERGDPLVEGVTSQCVDDVGYVAAVELEALVLDCRKGPHDLWVWAGPLEHLLYRQPLKLGHKQMLSILGEYDASFTGHQFFEVPPSDHVNLGQVDTRLGRQEPVYLWLALVPGGEGLHVDLDVLALWYLLAVCILLVHHF